MSETLDALVVAPHPDDAELGMGGAIVKLIEQGQRVGVLELDSFYPAKDRFELAMQLNNLLAAPGFQVWMKGERLDIGLGETTGDNRYTLLPVTCLGACDKAPVMMVGEELHEAVDEDSTR